MPLTKLPKFLYGGDYSPEQWDEKTWIKDLKLMQDAGINTVTLGIFCWSVLEPEEGKYDFSWLDRCIEILSDGGVNFILATPTAATPPWMSKHYPETRRVRHCGYRHPHRVRVNYCLSSPKYRERAREVSEALAKHYGKHPHLLMWHINNEYHADCHCELCQEKFRAWLRSRYASLDDLNALWWNNFWSHRYSDWDEIRSPAPWPEGEWSVQALWLDWNRFTGENYIELYENEKEAILPHSPGIPFTHNFHCLVEEDFHTHWRPLAEKLDVISIDYYPDYQSDGKDVERAISGAFKLDLARGYGQGKPFMMMESAPAASTGSKQQRPGVLRRTAHQAIAHGCDSALFFQWRSGRGQIEKFHGAFITHSDSGDTRVYQEAKALGRELDTYDRLLGSKRSAEVAMVYDRENHWAIELDTYARWDERDYLDTCLRHYAPFWRQGINVDVVSQYADLSDYRLLVAPVCYMLLPGFAERVKTFVAHGGVLLSGYYSGYVDMHDRCFQGGFPGPLRECFGLWVEELDGLSEGESNRVNVSNGLGCLREKYNARRFCDVIRVETADVLATYQGEYYAGMPAICRHTYGKGQTIYLGFLETEHLHDDLSAGLIEQLGIRRALDAPLPTGVSAQIRHNKANEFLIISNYSETPREVVIGPGWARLSTDEAVAEKISLGSAGSEILMRKR